MKIIVIATLLLYPMLTAQHSEPVFPDFFNKSLVEIQANHDWEIFAEARGNLNTDANDDFVIILQSKDNVLEKRCESCETRKHKARIILVLLSKDNSLKVVAQNNLFIARADEGGITEEMKPVISIANNQLHLVYQLKRGETSYSFETNGDGDVILVKATKLSASHYIFRSDVIDFKKGTLVTEQKSDKDEPVVSETEDLTLEKKFKKLAELKMMHTWDVGGVFL